MTIVQSVHTFTFFQVVALARREDRLNELAKSLEGKPGKLVPFKADVTVEEEILKAFKWTEENLGPVSVLVNNAGTARNTSLISGKYFKIYNLLLLFEKI